ncbi:hypothetical protein FRC05_003241 [Tulasnella sp. 425]|nr:hypothetical protein FRC05_003241 [Tulasnella sp. 425]
MSVIPIKEMDCDAAPESAEKSMSVGGDPRSGHSPTPLCILPDEIFLNIIRLSINSETPIQDLATLTTVCRPWKRILEGTPALWSEINASEGLGCIRKALRMAQGALLNIQVTRASSGVDLEAFSREIRGRILQWKTLLVEHDDWPQFASLTGLDSTAPPQLERLHLIHSQPSGPHENIVTLFGGEPAPPSLKDVRLEWVPVAIAPLRLSGLTSLVLSNPIHVPLEELVRVLEESPALKNLELSWWGSSASEDGEIAHPSIPRDQPTHLTSLRSLILLDIPQSIIRLLLSILRIPNVERIHINNMSEASPISALVTADLDHLIPVLLRITSAADRIRMTFYKNSYFAIIIGDFEFHWSTQLAHVPVFFDWLFIHVGVQPKETPTAIALLKCAHHIPQMAWLNSHFNVTRLALCSDRFSPQDPNDLLPFLSHPITVGSEASTPKWLFPNMEVFLSYSARPQHQARVASMIRERYSAVNAKDSTGVVPKPLLEIRLASACPPMFIIDIPVDENAFRTIQRESRGAEVYWEGQIWAGS